MSIDPRLRFSDNTGACPCLPPEVLGRLLDRIHRQPEAPLIERVRAALAQLRKKIAR